MDSKKVYEWISASVGTIHTFQGKEADGVILVLGASDNVNARNWVASSPNILNVALTRAKDFCLVVGDRNVWSQHAYFNKLAEALPPYPKKIITRPQYPPSPGCPEFVTQDLIAVRHRTIFGWRTTLEADKIDIH